MNMRETTKEKRKKRIRHPIAIISLIFALFFVGFYGSNGKVYNSPSSGPIQCPYCGEASVRCISVRGGFTSDCVAPSEYYFVGGGQTYEQTSTIYLPKKDTYLVLEEKDGEIRARIEKEKTWEEKTYSTGSVNYTTIRGFYCNYHQYVGERLIRSQSFLAGMDSFSTVLWGLAVLAVLPWLLDLFAVMSKKKSEQPRRPGPAIAGLSLTILALVVAVAARLFVFGDISQPTEADRKNAYDTAVSLVERGRYEEAASTFRALGTYQDSAEQVVLVIEAQKEAEQQKKYDAAISLLNDKEYEKAAKEFAELGDYRDCVSKTEEARSLWYEELYSPALDYYLSDEPISLPHAWNLFNVCPPDYKDTQLYKDEIDGIMNSLGGHYEKPKDKEKISISLGNDDSKFRIDYEAENVGNNFNYVNTTIKWFIKDGKAVYGTAEAKSWNFTVTPSENSMSIESNYEEFNGTYAKTRDW